MGKRTEAFLDGVYTGMDPIGTLLGYVTKKPYFQGYMFDNYSSKFWNVRKDTLQLTDSDVKVRTVEEQVLKGVGDVVGLASLILVVPQINMLMIAAKDYFGPKLKEEVISEVGKLTYRAI
jgi:hypothetical protein